MLRYKCCVLHRRLFSPPMWLSLLSYFQHCHQHWRHRYCSRRRRCRRRRGGGSRRRRITILSAKTQT